MNTRNFPEKGQALIVIALAAIVLFGFLALAVDGSMKFSDRRHAQNAADTAAIAAALARVRAQQNPLLSDNPAQCPPPTGLPSDVCSALLDAGKQRAKDNGYNNDVITNTVTIFTCDKTDVDCGPYTGNADYVKVTILSHIKTTFARVIGFTQMDNFVSSVAMAKNTTISGPLYPGSAIMSLNTSNCNGVSSKNVYVGGNAEVQIWAAGFGSASPYGSCLKFSSTKDTQIHKEDPVCPTGLTTTASQTEVDNNSNLSSLTNPDLCDPFTMTGATITPTYPDLGITCKGVPAVKSGSTLSPGIWDTSDNNRKPKDISTFQPGTYCIWGDLTLNKQDITGNGVTFVMMNGSLKLDGNIKVNLTAPTTDMDGFGNSTKGLLVYYPPSNSSTFTMGGTGEMNATMAGTVLAPKSDCSFQGTLQIQKGTYQFICNTWQAQGTADIQIVYDSTQLFNQVNPAQVGIVQ